jgi:hypothetical protein
MTNTPIRSGNAVIDFIFDACVNLLLLIGYLTGLSYNAVNVLIFCVIWPLLTIGLLGKVFFFSGSKRKLKLTNESRSNA